MSNLLPWVQRAWPMRTVSQRGNVIHLQTLAWLRHSDPARHLGCGAGQRHKCGLPAQIVWRCITQTQRGKMHHEVGLLCYGHGQIRAWKIGVTVDQLKAHMSLGKTRQMRLRRVMGKPSRRANVRARETRAA